MSIPGEEQEIPQRDNILGRTLRNGEYRIQHLLGQGGMGRVYLATHTTLHISLALKQVIADLPLSDQATVELDYILHGGDISQRPLTGNPEHINLYSSGGPQTDRFFREAHFLARLQHPAIPTLYDYFFEEGYWYLVMDYIPGETLSSYIKKHAGLPTLEALNYAMQLCDILDYLHKYKPTILFRDLKPANVMVTPEGGLVLIDFGIARYLTEPQDSSQSDLGSPGYAPPEQYQCDGQTDERSDLYSLGVILHEMISGQRPMEAQKNPQAFYDSEDTAEYLILPQHIAMTISTTLSSLLKLATRANLNYRFQSAQTFYLALERAYQIEEKHAYKRHLLQLSGAIPVTHNGHVTNSVISEVVHTEQIVVESVPFVTTRTLGIEQRKQMREELHRVRKEHMEQDQLEQQLATVDESLRRRSNIPLSQLSLHMPATKQKNQAHVPYHRIVQISFIVALTLFLVMVSLLIYARIVPQPEGITQKPQVTVPLLQTVALPTATSTSYENYWQALPALPEVAADNTAVYAKVNGKEYIYITGGYRGDQTPTYDRTLYRYDIAKSQWETVKIERFPGMINNAVIQDQNGNIFYSAGYSTDNYTIPSLLYKFDPKKKQIQKITPPKELKIGFANAMIADQKNNLYLTQGFLKAGDAKAKAGKGWYRYNTVSKNWKELEPLPVGLGYVTLIVVNNNNILLLGGAKDAGQQQQSRYIYSYDTEQDSWTQAPDTAPHAISGASSCMVWPHQLLVIGGYNPVRNTGSNEAWLFDLRSGRWKQLVSFTIGNSVLGAAACDGQGHAYIVRGGSDPKRPTKDFWETVVAPGITIE